MKETNNNDLLTVKENEIIRLATPLKIVNYKAYDLDDNPIDCIETFSKLNLKRVFLVMMKFLNMLLILKQLLKLELKEE